MEHDLEFIAQPVIETSRLHLRPPTLADAVNVAEGLNDFDVAKMLVRVPWPYALEGAVWWINQWLEGRENGWCFAITERQHPDHLVGIVSVEPANGSYEMGWWLAQTFWGRGYMTEAVEAVVNHVWREDPKTILKAGAISDNPASLRIQEKLGFKVACTEMTDCVSRGMKVEVVKTILNPNML